ncbi:hypothetical protein L1987_64883 [Smallanthus sonchifolius]|uniref:Uncharacterized protein n=1 Tax=Smallanthus sonchifolius TaxID=185202 RepID=A0ACB9BT47_9ASTR|nr:hypothetical protein L1987_64883 [Smallanthus sonchifolius]
MASKLKVEKPRRVDGSFFYPQNGLIGLLNSPPSITISSAVTSYFHLLFDFDADLRVYSASEALKAELRIAATILFIASILTFGTNVQNNPVSSSIQ